MRKCPVGPLPASFRLPAWVLCRTVAEAHGLCSLAVQAALSPPSSSSFSSSFSPSSSPSPPPGLHGLLCAMRAVEGRLAAALHVPRDVTRLPDLPLFLAETLRPPHCAAGRFARLSEAALLAEFDEWVRSSGAPPAAAAADTMPFLRLTAFVQSYERYHRGVLWGAARPADRSGAAAAAFHRRAYRLHPWHGVACPEGWAAQMPYVHVLQWMAQGGEDGRQFTDHRATERFAPPSARGGAGRHFTALDVCCQSGHGVDLLLKAGAARVVALDASTPALGNTEATVHEHRREKRSRNLGTGGRANNRREVVVQRCELLPEVQAANPNSAAAAPAQTPQAAATASPAATGATDLFASAATRRRQLARGLGRAYEQQQQEQQQQVQQDGPYDVLYYHPPVPAVWPLAALPAAPPANSVWWRLVQDELQRRAPSAGPLRPLPFLLAPTCSESGGTAPSTPHPHQSLATLERFVRRLRADAAPPAEDGEGQGTNLSSRPLLREEAYVVCVLPRSYDPLADLARLAGAKHGSSWRDYFGVAGDSLSDFVVGQLDGLYDVVLRRRHFMGNETKTPGQAAFSSAAAPLLRYADAQMEGLRGGGESFREQAGRFFGTQWWVDVLVLRKNKRPPRQLSAGADGKGNGGQRPNHPRTPVAPPPVEWEDSFQHNEYMPQSAPHTRYHWTDLVPTYSYLEKDHYDTAGTEGAAAKVEANFLAVGHPPELRREEGASATTARTSAERVGEAAAAAERFKNVFSEELRNKRRSKLRKMAFAPIDQQEWYIDEKLIKAEAAKVDFMNELSRWDFQDYDT